MTKRRNPAPQSRGVTRTPTAISTIPMTMQAVRFSIRPRIYLEGLKGRLCPGLPGSSSAEWKDLVDQLGVGEDHPAAAVPFQPKGVQHLPRVLPLAGAFDEGGERAADDLAAREASDWDDHGLTDTTSAASCARRGPAASSGACGGYPGPSTLRWILCITCRGRCRLGIGPARGRWSCVPRT